MRRAMGLLCIIRFDKFCPPCYSFYMYESGEDYLEAILRLQAENGFVRSVDVARKLNVSRPSVSRAMAVLQEGGYIEFSLGNMIKLTPSGKAKAEDIYSRHKLLTAFLVAITGLSVEQAEENACRMEHYIDADVVSGIKNWMKTNNVSEDIALSTTPAADEL